jgi:hypothetical protein
VNHEEAEKIARTESVFREVNERIAETAKRFDVGEASFICECPDTNCAERVEATLEEYEQVRQDSTKFLVAPGHEDRRIESVVEVEDDHAVVDKQDPRVAPRVHELDPRTD